MLAMANSKGLVEASIPGLAVLARVSEKECREAMTCLEAPDKDSRSQEYQGRRIKKVDGGWMLLNYAKYRQKLSADERREYQTVKQREYRERDKNTFVDKSGLSSTVTTQAEAEATTDTEEENTLSRVPLLGSVEFKAFYEAYPVKTGRKAALREWVVQRLDSIAYRVMVSLAAWKASERWNNLKFVPYPAKWLSDQWKSEPVKGEVHGKESFSERRSKQSAQAINRVLERFEKAPGDLHRALPPDDK